MTVKWYVEQPEVSNWAIPEGPDKTMGVEHYVMDNWTPLVGAGALGFYTLLRIHAYRPGNSKSMSIYSERLAQACGTQRLEVQFYLATLELCGLVKVSQPTVELWTGGVDRIIDVVLPPPQRPSDRLIDLLMGSYAEDYHERVKSLKHLHNRDGQ